MRRYHDYFFVPSKSQIKLLKPYVGLDKDWCPKCGERLRIRHWSEAGFISAAQLQCWKNCGWKLDLTDYDLV